MANGVDLILFNGSIITMNPAQPRVSALAIQFGRIVAAGSDSEITPLAGANTIRHNLNGRAVIPGITDAHIHFLGTTGLLHTVDLFDVPSLAEALDRVAARAAKTPKGEWIEGYGWWQERWAERQFQFPTRQDLDRVAPDHPVFLRGRSGHAAWVNTLALRLCGIDRDTHDPEGGAIGHDSDGEPDGILYEWSAMGKVSGRIPPRTTDQIADQMRDTQSLMLSMGITAFHDMDDPPCLSALQVMRERGELHLRVLKQINQKYLPAAVESGIRFGFGDDQIRIGALKLFADGALGPRTAAMFDPYEGEPDNRGITVLDKEEIASLIVSASRAGLPTSVHAIGDRAVHDVLDAFEAARLDEAERGIPRSARRHRIEHVQVIHPSDVGRLASLDVIASMQPVHATSDYQTADRYWGARSAYAYNPRLQLDQGARVILGSDSPYDILDPWQGIYAAVTRRRIDGSPGESGWYPEARLSLQEALHGYTAAPPYAAGLENRLGRLAPGYYADLVILDRDPFALPDNEILSIRPQATMVNGQWAYDRQQQK